MDRKERIEQVAEQLQSVLARNKDLTLYEHPNEVHTIVVSGAINLFDLAEWMYARMG